MIRFWWADAADFFATEQQIAHDIAGPLAGWDVIRWDETFFEDGAKKKEQAIEESFQSLVSEIEAPSIFSAGKIIRINGLPSTHSRLADELHNIPEGTLVIMLARLDKTLRLMGKAKELGSLAKIDEPLRLTRQGVSEWMSRRAKILGGKIDETSCRMLVDLLGLDANAITSEMRKLILLAEDGAITPWVVQQAAYGTGESDFFEMMDYAMAGNRPAAHEKLRRLVATGGAESITGLLMDWARKMAIAEGLGRNDAGATSALGAQKRDKGFDAKNHSMRIGDFNTGSPKKAPIPMFKDTKGIYRACMDIAGKKDNWGYDMVRLVHRAILANRQDGDGQRIMGCLLDSIMER